MKSGVYQCAECGKETDANEEASTWCSTCKNQYCEAMSYPCFVSHHRKSGCKGSAMTIINPTWTVNLVKTMEK